MKRFIGRSRELAILEDAYRSPASAFVPIYGRRRVGKSELILKFLEGKPGLYSVGKKAPAALHIREFLQDAAAALDEPLLRSLSIGNWQEALDAVVRRWKGPGKLVVALDEFQWMTESSPELPSVLQVCWDRSWKNTGTVMVILCGSYVGFMERQILGRKSPLFGRRTAQILLKPFDFLDAARFHPSYSVLDRARIYFICGGVPLYLNFVDPSRSVEANIERCLLDEFAPLHREPDFLLREELRDVENYYAVMFALASGSLTSQEIARQAQVAGRSLFYYLQQLTELGYISRRYPLTERKPPARHVRFAVEDPLLRFWFRFVYPNLSHLLHAGSARTFRDRILPDLDAYFGGGFERLCREAMPQIYLRDGVRASVAVGEYWDKSVQIDVVGLRDDGWTDLGECRWGRVRSARAVRDELEAKKKAYPNTRNATIGLHAFTRHAVKAVSGDPVSWHSLEEIYSLPARPTRS